MLRKTDTPTKALVMVSSSEATATAIPHSVSRPDSDNRYLNYILLIFARARTRAALQTLSGSAAAVMRQQRLSKRRLIRRNEWQKLNWKAITTWIPIQKWHIPKKLKVLPSRSAPSSSSPPSNGAPSRPPLMNESEGRERKIQTRIPVLQIPLHFPYREEDPGPPLGAPSRREKQRSSSPRLPVRRTVLPAPDGSPHRSGRAQEGNLNLEPRQDRNTHF